MRIERVLYVTMFLLINPISTGPVQQSDDEDSDNTELHLHAAVNDLDSLLSEIQSKPIVKHPKDISLAVSQEIEDEKMMIDGEVVEDGGAPKGIVEKELVEKMKNFDSLNKALQSLSDATDKMADDKCDNTISGSDNCKQKDESEEDSSSSESWMSSVVKSLFG